MLLHLNQILTIVSHFFQQFDLADIKALGDDPEWKWQDESAWPRIFKRTIKISCQVPTTFQWNLSCWQIYFRKMDFLFTRLQNTFVIINLIFILLTKPFSF